MLRKLLWVGVLALLALGCSNAVGSDGDQVGGPCVVNSECYIDSVCLDGWPGGYCAQACDADEDCPSGSACTEEGIGYCLVACGSDAECRSDEGYACVEREARGAGGTVMVCATP